MASERSPASRATRGKAMLRRVCLFVSSFFRDRPGQWRPSAIAHRASGVGTERIGDPIGDRDSRRTTAPRRTGTTRRHHIRHLSSRFSSLHKFAQTHKTRQELVNPSRQTTCAHAIMRAHRPWRVRCPPSHDRPSQHTMPIVRHVDRAVAGPWRAIRAACALVATTAPRWRRLMPEPAPPPPSGRRPSPTAR